MATTNGGTNEVHKAINELTYGSSGKGKRPIKIGVISACQGDRIDSLLQMLSGPIEIDGVAGDYLAELNLAWHAMKYEKDQSA
ncbi:hypothetical protein MMC08_003324 [Hypocenomyce scalaris]|nr:hypothetical protein [Hypocenomyce scalaris]